MVNGKVLVPVYGDANDVVALQIYSDNLPSYEVVGINCSSIITSGGSIHCVTQTIPSAFELGDLNQDDLTDSQDVIIMAYYFAGDFEPGQDPFNAPLISADLKGDGRVDVKDLVQFIVNLTE